MPNTIDHLNGLYGDIALTIFFGGKFNTSHRWEAEAKFNGKAYNGISQKGPIEALENLMARMQKDKGVSI